MNGLTDLIGVLINCGMITSGNRRIVNAVGSSGLKALDGLLQHDSGVTNIRSTHMRANITPGFNLFGSLFKIVTSIFGVEQSPSQRGVLASTRFGGARNFLFDRRSVSTNGSALGGQAMALLVIMAFQSFKKIKEEPVGMRTAIGSSEILLGMRTSANSEEEKLLEKTATLILRGMINAAKVDSQIGYDEIQKIIAQIRASDSSVDIQQLIFEEMQRPLNLDDLVDEIPNETVAALVYAASLFAIEVDTPAQRDYLESFVQRTGLDVEVAHHLQVAVGVN